MRIAVTTSRRVTPDLVTIAEDIACELRVEYLERGKTRIDSYYEDGYDCLVDVCPEKIRVFTFLSDSKVEEFFFHPNMALVRIKRLQTGGSDLMVEAMGLTLGDHVLDCTLGMGSDAIVASYVAGDAGRIVTLESSPVISAIVKRGLQSWSSSLPEILDAMKRIEVVNTDYQSYLKDTQDKFDVVYFDPMFENPLDSSKGISPMRRFSKGGGVDLTSFERAKEIAKKSVVIKSSVYSDELMRLRIANTIGHRNGTFEYGVLRRI